MKQTFEKYDLRRVGEKIRRVARERRGERDFQKWVKIERAARQKRSAAMRREIEKFTRKPLISVVMPVYNVEGKWLRRAIESVAGQLYENWELCVADDCSPSPRVREILEEYAARDERIKIIFRKENGHISAASNSALELAAGEFVGLLDHDDELSEDALYHVARELNAFPAADFIYSDEDKIDETGKRYEPQFKPDFSRDFFYSVNYVTHFAVYRAAILRSVGGFRAGFEGSQDYDLALRVVERIAENHIRHIPKILYHWRAIKGSVALAANEKPYAHERARAALRSHFERTGKKASVSETVYNLHRVRYELPADLPKVNLIFAADENYEVTERAIKNYAEQTDYENYEIVLLIKNSRAFEPTNLPRVKVIVCESGSEAERLNQAVRETNGEVLCFADANLKPLSKDWLKEIIGFAVQTEIGAVGAKILSAGEEVLHGGLIIGIKNSVGIAHHNLARRAGGNYVRAQIVNNFSAVSIAGLTVRRKAFQAVGGFDAANFPNKFFDADFCLRLREQNLRNVFTPYAELIQIDKRKLLNPEKNSTEKEINFFRRRWQSVIGRDPFYNPNLSYESEDFAINI